MGYSRIRSGDIAENFAILRRLALNLLKQDCSTKISLKRKRLRAALDDNRAFARTRGLSPLFAGFTPAFALSSESPGQLSTSCPHPKLDAIALGGKSYY
jgi:hypothetical protein